MKSGLILYLFSVKNPQSAIYLFGLHEKSFQSELSILVIEEPLF
jgi:hypothetical protein